MFEKIIKLANYFDSRNQSEQADRLDTFIQKWSKSGQKPTMKDLLREEAWLKNAMPEPDYFETGQVGDLVTDLQEQQLQDVQSEGEQEALLRELSDMISSQETTPDMLPHQRPIMAEATVLQDFETLANILDQNNLSKHADYFDKLLLKWAQDPTDGDDEDDFGDEEDALIHDFEEEDDDFFKEPTTDELMKMEKDPDDFMYRMLAFISMLAEDGFISLEAAKEEAVDLLKDYDTIHNVPEMEDEESFGMSDNDMDEDLPENILEFPKK